MARIGLVNPQLASSSWAAPVMRSRDDASIKHGLASLSACLKAKGHEVRLIDLRRLRGWEEYEAVVRKGKFDCLGITANTSEHDDALECGLRARRVQPSILTIAGGIQPTMFPEEFVETEGIDYVLKGEGEVGITEWIENPSGFPPVFEGKTPDLDAIPFEDRALWSDYRRRTLFPYMRRQLGTPMVEMIAHRGCPWHCRFCCGPGEKNVFSKVRVRSVENVMQELSELQRQYRFRSIYFHDDQFLIFRKWVEEFSLAMHDWGFVKKDIRFTVSMRADTIIENEALVRSLKGAGLEFVTIGFESFSDRILTWMNKGVTKAQSLEAARILRDLKLKFRANVMLGTPWSDGRWHVEDDLMTMMTVARIRPEVVNVAFFSPIPGSPFYEWFKDRGLIVASGMKELGCLGKVLKVKGVDYDFLDTLIRKKQPVPGRLRKGFKSVLEKLKLAEPLRRLRYELKAWKAHAEAFLGRP